MLHGRRRCADYSPELHRIVSQGPYQDGDWLRVIELLVLILLPMVTQMKRIPPIKLDRRWRQKVRGVVTPSPVGPAIEYDKTPSPPIPSPAVEGPFTTKIVHSMILPMRDMTDVSRE